MCMSSCRLQLPPLPVPTVPLPFTVPLSHCPQPPLHLSLIMFDCCHCSRTFHGAGAPSRQAAPKIEISSPSRSKGGCVGVEPEPEPESSWVEAQTKPSSNLALFVVPLFSLHVSVCLSVSPSVPQSVLGVFFFSSLFLFELPFWLPRSLSALFKLYAFKKRLRINWIISFFYYLFSARNS